MTAAAPPNNGWGLLLSCGKSGALEGVLINIDPVHYAFRVADVKAKVNDTDSAITLRIQQMILPGMVKLRGLDAVERRLLQNERLMVRLTIPGADDYTGTFVFHDIKSASDAVLSKCPPF